MRKLAAGHMRDFVAGDGDAARGGNVEATKKIEQGSLAGTARTHEGDKVALIHIEIKPLEHLDFFAAAAVGLVQTADANQTLRTTVPINTDHASLLLADFDFVTIMQTLRPLHDDGIAGGQAGHHGNVRAAIHSEAHGAPLDLAISKQVHKRGV